MGVIYKLKDEVIGFIVEQKKGNPNLSCRRLVEIVREKFQIEVSKSSVNAVIKQSALSSPVGRRAKEGRKPQKFAIPDEKKTLLSEEREKAGLLEIKPS